MNLRQSNTIPGIHIQWPWSQLIVAGAKTVETRGYRLPTKYEGLPLAIIETAGKKGFRDAGIKAARIIGIVIFRRSFRYPDEKAWLKDRGRHLVDMNDSDFSYSSTSEKWGWEIQKVQKLDAPIKPPVRRGIVFVNGCRI